MNGKKWIMTTYLIDIMGIVDGGCLHLLVDGLVDLADALVNIVGGRLATLADISGDILRLSLEGVWITRFDGVDGLVGDIVCSNDKRSKLNLEGFCQFVRRARKLFGVSIGRAGVRV